MKIRYFRPGMPYRNPESSGSREKETPYSKRENFRTFVRKPYFERIMYL